MRAFLEPGKEQLQLYMHLSEPQLLHYYEPAAGLFIAESPKVICRALDAGYEPESLLLADHMKTDAETLRIIERCGAVPVYAAPEETLRKMAGFTLTRGVLCAMRRRALPKVEALCRDVKRIAILENVMNPTNVGAIFRSAAALGIDAVLLTPDCSDPLYRRAVRVSMGTVFQVPWTCLKKEEGFWPEGGMRQLKELGFQTAALALSDESVSIADPRLASSEKLAVILGAEGDGLAKETIASCDYCVKIPMFHGVDSLNVAAASAVAFWELAGKRIL